MYGRAGVASGDGLGSRIWLCLARSMGVNRVESGVKLAGYGGIAWLVEMCLW